MKLSRRHDYACAGLLESEALADPFAQFDVWFEQALAAQVIEPNAMTLATASAAGIPSARIVLLRGFDARGFVFFTNYESAKGKELADNSRAALVFFWPEVERQVRVEGTAAKVAREESLAYFRARPLGSQIGAWASPQSSVIAGREALDERVRAAEEEFRDEPVPLPPHWGGYRVAAHRIEFWQGRPNRLHDRIRYVLEGSSWRRERLAP